MLQYGFYKMVKAMQWGKVEMIFLAICQTVTTPTKDSTESPWNLVVKACYARIDL